MKDMKKILKGFKAQAKDCARRAELALRDTDNLPLSCERERAWTLASYLTGRKEALETMIAELEKI